jgi:hypothetical protein
MTKPPPRGLAPFAAAAFFLVLALGLTGCATTNVGQAVASSIKARNAKAAALFSSDRITTVLVGTGSPMPSQRAHASTAVFVGGQFLLFDCGDGSARELESLGLPVARLDAVFFTHFYSDHFADLGEVIDRSWVNGRRQKLVAYGSEGIADIATLASDAGVKRLALTHLAPPIDGDAQVRVVFVNPITAVYKGDSVGLALLQIYQGYGSALPYTITHHVITNGNVWLPLARLSSLQKALLSPLTGPFLSRVLTPGFLAKGLASSVYYSRLDILLPGWDTDRA